MFICHTITQSLLLGAKFRPHPPTNEAGPTRKTIFLLVLFLMLIASQVKNTPFSGLVSPYTRWNHLPPSPLNLFMFGPIKDATCRHNLPFTKIATSILSGPSAEAGRVQNLAQGEFPRLKLLCCSTQATVSSPFLCLPVSLSSPS